MRPPKISIIVPVYNAGKWVRLDALRERSLAWLKKALEK